MKQFMPYEEQINRSYDKKLKYIENDTKLSQRNKELILRFLNECELGKTIRKGQKREIGKARLLQSAGFLNRMAKDWFKKDLDQVTDKDMEKFILDLNKGNIKTSSRVRKETKPYSSETKSNIKKFIRKFYKWLLGDSRRYPDLVEWIDTSKKETIVSAIPNLDKGVLKIVELIPDIRRKALIWVAFDSGFRMNEIISTKIKDVEKREDNYFYLTCKVSKTKPRTVGLGLSSKLLERWLEKHPDKNNPNSSLFQTSRVMFYKTMRLYSQKALGNEFTPHQLRHTSATYFAKKLDRVSFCKKYGWSYTSNTPDRYIDFAKVTQDHIIDLMEHDKIGELKKENQELKLQINQLKDDVRLFKNIFENPKLKKAFEEVLTKKS